MSDPSSVSGGTEQALATGAGRSLDDPSDGGPLGGPGRVAGPGAAAGESEQAATQGESGPGPAGSEQLRILELLEQHRITTAEAAELLQALEAPPRGRRERGRRPEAGHWREREHRDSGRRWSAAAGGRERQPEAERGQRLRIRVTDLQSGAVRTDVVVPIGAFGPGLDFVRRLRLPGIRRADDLLEALRAGRRGMVFDRAGGHGERVEILIE